MNKENTSKLWKIIQEADKIFMPEQPTILNPLLHQTTMDLLALMTLEPLKIFKK